MTYEPGALRGYSRDIVAARNWGVCGATGLAGMVFFVSEFQRIRSLQFEVLQYAYLAVLLLTGVLIFGWIWTTQKELDLLFDWLDPECWYPPSNVKDTCLILLIAATITALVFTARDPLMYGILFTLYSAILIPATIYMNREIGEAIERSRSRLFVGVENPELTPAPSLYLEGVNVLDEYFLKRPVIRRLIAILLASVLSTMLAAWWHVSNKSTCGILAYAGFFITILCSELVIWNWRAVRDDALRRLLRDLVDVRRKNAVPRSRNS